MVRLLNESMVPTCTPLNSPNSSNLLSPFNLNGHSDVLSSPFYNNSHISSLTHCVPTSFDSDKSSKSLSSLGLEHLDVQKSLLSSEFHQNDTFTVNYLSIIHTYLPTYHQIITPGRFFYITTFFIISTSTISTSLAS